MKKFTQKGEKNFEREKKYKKTGEIKWVSNNLLSLSRVR